VWTPGSSGIVDAEIWISSRAAIMMWMPSMPSWKPLLLRFSSGNDWIELWCWAKTSGVLLLPPLMVHDMWIWEVRVLVVHVVRAERWCPVESLFAFAVKVASRSFGGGTSCCRNGCSLCMNSPTVVMGGGGSGACVVNGGVVFRRVMTLDHF
jgi:hypothetical protein